MDQKMKDNLSKFYNWLIDYYNDRVEFGIEEEMTTMDKVIKKFERLINRVIANSTRDTFHRSMEYLTNVFKEISDQEIIHIKIISFMILFMWFNN